MERQILFLKDIASYLKEVNKISWQLVKEIQIHHVKGKGWKSCERPRAAAAPLYNQWTIKSFSKTKAGKLPDS